MANKRCPCQISSRAKPTLLGFAHQESREKSNFISSRQRIIEGYTLNYQSHTFHGGQSPPTIPGQAYLTIMSEYRRYYVKGGIVFFTVITKNRARFLCDTLARKLLHEKILECRKKWPFELTAIVLVPDHLHALWTMPVGEEDYSQRWGWIKKEFTKGWLAAGGPEEFVNTRRRQRNDRGVWQPRFWEHQICDEDDFERHLDYIHYNPAKHGLAASPKDWPYSSFRNWVAKGVYSIDWAISLHKPLDFSDLDESALE
jgi:putative transposase